jgi:hypothetical protein
MRYALFAFTARHQSSSPISLRLSDGLSDQEQAAKELFAAKRIHKRINLP